MQWLLGHWKTGIWQGRWAICENTVPMTYNNPNVINSQHWECKQNCVLGEKYEEVLHMQLCAYSEGVSWNKWDICNHYGTLPHKNSPILFLQIYPCLLSLLPPYSNVSLTTKKNIVLCLQMFLCSNVCIRELLSELHTKTEAKYGPRFFCVCIKI